MSKTAKVPEDASKVKPISTIDPEDKLMVLPQTDTGNAERLAWLCKDTIRYCIQWKCWLVWNGKVWIKDEGDLFVHQKAKGVIRETYKKASAHGDNGLMAFARESEGRAKLNSMIDLARSEKGIPINANALDRNKWILNTQSGVLDLRTGKELTHRADQMSTKIANVRFVPGEDCPIFKKFMLKIFDGNKDIVDYMQRAIGYSLSGSVQEKAVFCLYGKDGHNGKTTLLELIKWMLGDYATLVMVDSLMVKNQESGTTMADLAGMAGARFVVTSEVDKTQKLAEGKMKHLTGGGELKGCMKYENPFTFLPTHKIFIDANHRPKVTGTTDKAMWSRLKLIPFLVRLADGDVDKALPEKLQVEGSGILNWALEGCLKWQAQGGLGEPVEVTEAVETWRTHDDVFKKFFEDRCVFDAKYYISVTEMWAEFESWAKDFGVKASRVDLHERLGGAGAVEERIRLKDGNRPRVWKHVGLSQNAKKPVLE